MNGCVRGVLGLTSYIKKTRQVRNEAMIAPIVSIRIADIVQWFKQNMDKKIKAYREGDARPYGLKMRCDSEKVEEIQQVIDEHDGWMVKVSREKGDWVFVLDVEKVNHE